MAPAACAIARGLQHAPAVCTAFAYHASLMATRRTTGIGAEPESKQGGSTAALTIEPPRIPCPSIIIERVRQFAEHIDIYQSTNYSEAQLRIDFLNPMLETLGWDVNNTRGWAEAYRDVVYEDALKIGGTSKAPDYGFYIGGRAAGGGRKFFLEAKKPSVAIRLDPEPAFQLRRYAYSAQLPLSILTNFKDFIAYDTRYKPRPDDKPTAAAVFTINYTEYPERWDEIASVLSREAILKGAFDKFVQGKRKKGIEPLGDAFLKDIETWRDLLAREIAKHNTLTVEQLNFAVQRTIDRVLFLRICEDRGIEPANTLKSLASGDQVYARLGKIFRDADDKYNSGIFHFPPVMGRRPDADRAEPPDELTLDLTIDDKPLKKIIRDLYDAPGLFASYAFAVIPPEILGQVYERFLGKVITLKNEHTVKIEEKPEVRKAGGVYYTPIYIVDYIVRNTVGKLLDGKAPKDAESIRILDPASGSGSFLIGAYEFLLNWHLKWYLEHDPEKHCTGRNPPLMRVHSPSLSDDPALPSPSGRGAYDYLLTTAKRKEILLNSIYGVDIDAQAVEVTKLSLLLKVLEGESKESIAAQMKFYHQRALPDLGRNIKCGNSLIGDDFDDSELSDEERRKINKFNWQKVFPKVFKDGGFDVVIGNPPYDVLEKDRGASSWPHVALRQYIRESHNLAPALGGKTNLYRFFVVRSIELLAANGRFGMIIPLSLLADFATARTRDHVFRHLTNCKADCFPQKDNASRRVFVDAKLSTMVLTGVRSARDVTDSCVCIRTYPWNSFADVPRENNVSLLDIKAVDSKNWQFPLVDRATWEICVRVHNAPHVLSLGDLRDFKTNRGEINQTVYRTYITNNPRHARLVKGGEIGRYCQRATLKQGEREWFNEKAFLKNVRAKSIIQHRRIATQRITGVDERLRVVATIIESPAYFADSTNSIILASNTRYRLEYLLGHLNSRLYQWRFKITSSNNNVGTNELESLPIRTIDFANKADKAAHDRMVKFVERMLDLHKQLAAPRTTPTEQERLQRDIESTDRQIDQLVYELYRLTAEEIEVVERATNPAPDATASQPDSSIAPNRS
jgi:hypothetical protein